MTVSLTVYRRAWTTIWLTLSAVPVFFGLLVSSVPAVFCLAAMTATIAAMMGCRPATWLGAGLLASATIAGLCWLGTAGLGVLVLIAATSPTAVSHVAGLVRRARRHRPGRHRRGRDRSGRRGERHPGLGVEEPVPADRLVVLARCLDDEQLCEAWSESYVALRRAPTAAERHALVNLRQAYLDELETRNAPGFRSWLRSGARPVENPRAFIETHRPVDED